MVRELFTKIYARINWKNRSEAMTTALGATLLNRMDYALDETDSRIVTLDTVKAEESEVLQMVKEWSMDEKTGIITVTKKNGEKIMFDLNIEKIPVSFTLSPQGILTMTTDDGTKFTADIGSMIPVLTFKATDTINVSVEGSGVNKTYSFSVKEGSIKDKHLQPSYLADITVQAQAAANSSTEAQTQADRAKTEADRAKQEADKAAEVAGSAAGVSGVKGAAETTYRHGEVNITSDNIGITPDYIQQQAMNHYYKALGATYPTTQGIYRATGTATAGKPTGSSTYGTLVIFGQGYVTHVWFDVVNYKIWIGNTADSITAPSSWESYKTAYADRAGTATKLAASKTFQANLALTNAVAFDGSANNVHGVTGVLGVANGGTGLTSLNDLFKRIGLRKYDYISQDTANGADYSFLNIPDGPCITVIYELKSTENYIGVIEYMGIHLRAGNFGYGANGTNDEIQSVTLGTYGTLNSTLTKEAADGDYKISTPKGHYIDVTCYEFI